MHFGHKSRAITLLFLNEIIPLAITYHSSLIPMSMQSLKKIGKKILKLEHGNEVLMDRRKDTQSGGYNIIPNHFLFVCLFVLRLNIPVNNFSSCRDGAIASWVINQYFRGVKCLAQGHNTVAVGFEPPTSRSGVRHSTTEPPRSSNHFLCGGYKNVHIIFFFHCSIIGKL